MKTLYKSSSRIAAAIVGSLVLSTSAAIALTRQAPAPAPLDDVASLGRFVVTAQRSQYQPPAEHLGRFIVTPQQSAFVPNTAAATTAQ
jgi:hypothetical protein